jgi:predicted small lipoprotein YifL
MSKELSKFMKKIVTIVAALFATFSLAACGNNSAKQSEPAASSSQVSHQSQPNSSSHVSSQSQSQTTATHQSSSSSQTSAMTTSQVIARVAQLKNVNLNGGDKIYVTPTATPNVFKIYIKGANQDPQVDSIIDHYIYNGNTDTISQAADR